MRTGGDYSLLTVKSRDKTPLTCCEVCIKNEREGRIVTERERERTERRRGLFNDPRTMFGIGVFPLP